MLRHPRDLAAFLFIFEGVNNVKKLLVPSNVIERAQHIRPSEPFG